MTVGEHILSARGVSVMMVYGIYVVRENYNAMIAKYLILSFLDLVLSYGSEILAAYMKKLTILALCKHYFFPKKSLP